MKKVIILVAVAITAAFLPAKAKADAGGLILNVSGTVKLQDINSTNKETVTLKSINEKYVYNVISNALANIPSITGISSLDATNLPADGYIAFNPSFELDGVTNGPSTPIYGLFYVTNKSNFYFPLSGSDKNGQFYSFIELDTYLYYSTGNGPGTLDLDFGYFGSDVGSYGVSGKTGDGSGTSTSTGLLYIHDNPYTYDEFDQADNFYGTFNNYYGVEFSNNNVIEIHGIVTGKITLKNFAASSESFSLTGNGSFFNPETDVFFEGIVSSATAKLSP